MEQSTATLPPCAKDYILDPHTPQLLTPLMPGGEWSDPQRLLRGAAPYESFASGLASIWHPAPGTAYDSCGRYHEDSRMALAYFIDIHDLRRPAAWQPREGSVNDEHNVYGHARFVEEDASREMQARLSMAQPAYTLNAAAQEPSLAEPSSMCRRSAAGCCGRPTCGPTMPMRSLRPSPIPAG